MARTRAHIKRPTRTRETAESAQRQISYYKRLLEDLTWLPVPWLGQQYDSDGWSGVGGGFRGVSDGSIGDRQGGRNLPLFWNEIDLRGFRVLSRQLCESNDFAIGFSGLLTDYHVRKGYGWQACRKGAKKSPYATTAAPADPLVEKGQLILDAWRAAVKWPILAREAFKRWRRDGEAAGRFFAQGWQKLPLFRFVDPSQIGSPTGDTNGDDSFGIATPPGDTAGEPISFHIWSHEVAGVGDWVDADRIVFAKANVDSDVKRGLPDFFPVAEALDGAQKLVHTMLATAIRQARVAWREKYPSATAEQVRSMIPQGANSLGTSTITTPESQPWWMDRSQGQRFGINGFKRSDVVRVEGNREYEAGPTMAGASTYIEVEQAALRACGVRWRMPEYFSGDASNNNMASSFVANSPFVTAVECSQEEWAAAWEKAVALKVLEYARDAGFLSYQEWSQLDAEVMPAAVATPDSGKDTDTITKQLQEKIISLDTARQKLGYDPQHEAEGVKKDAASAQPQQAPGTPPSNTPPSNPPAPDGGGGIFGEAVIREGFTGTIKDSAGAERHYVDGKQVAAPKDAGAKTDPAAKPTSQSDANQHAAKAERQRKDAVGAEHYLSTAKERPQPKHLAGAAKYKDVARRRRVIAALKNEGELAQAIEGHNLPDSEPADVVHIQDSSGKPLTNPQQVKDALLRREAAVKTLETGKVHLMPRSGNSVIATDRDADEDTKAFAANVLSEPATFFEVKTLLTSSKNAVYMNPQAKKRKARWAKKYHVGFAVVAVDSRRGQKHSGHNLYVLPDTDLSASGTVKLDSMKKVGSMAEVAKAVRS